MTNLLAVLGNKSFRKVFMRRRKMDDSFSYRNGIKKRREILQLKDIDKPLRNEMANLIDVLTGNIYKILPYDEEARKKLGHILVKEHTSIHSLYIRDFISETKKTFGSYDPFIFFDDQWIRDIRRGEWNKVYDTIEFIFDVFDGRYGEISDLKNLDMKNYAEQLNKILEKHLSGYRLLKSNKNWQITPITDKTELAAIQEAMDSCKNEKLTETGRNLDAALKHLSDRENPDYKACIVACFKACESVTKFYLGKQHENKSLGALLSTIPEEEVPSALKEGFKKYYGYGSQKARHGKGDSPTQQDKITKDHSPTFDEAKFFLVACHAYVNYFVSKKKDKS